jgi:Predicted transcriptional regulators
MSGSCAPRIDCAIDVGMSVIEGKWKAPILCKLVMKGNMRFNQLMRELQTVSPRILTKQLKEMERDGLIKRTPCSDAVGVEYSITEKGISLACVLKPLIQWAIDNMYLNRVRFSDDIVLPKKTAAQYRA